MNTGFQARFSFLPAKKTALRQDVSLWIFDVFGESRPKVAAYTATTLATPGLIPRYHSTLARRERAFAHPTYEN
jgi:hypothetical protein